MSESPIDLPVARTWREIPQHVKPRAMSTEGKRRVLVRFLRIAGGVMIVCVGSAATWQVYSVLKPGPRDAVSAARKAEPIGDHVKAVTDGVLDSSWVRGALRLPGTATLDSVALEELRIRVLANRQVASASIVRQYPSTLEVRMSERMPVARISLEVAKGSPARTFLVAADGVAYEGTGYDPRMIEALPWLAGFDLLSQGKGYAPIPGMPIVADFLSRSRLEAEALYRTWRVVSLARLESDGLIELKTAAGLKVTFGTRGGGDLFSQLARLDLILDTVVKAQPAQSVREINLSLGREVPVAMGAGPAPERSVPARLSPPANRSFKIKLSL